MDMAAREISVTAWLDPVFKYFADQAGIPVRDYTAQVGGEGIGVALETVADFFTKGWLNKTIQFVAGLLADGYAIWGKDVPIRLRKELLGLGTHELLRFVDPKPSDVIEFQRSLTQFIDGMRRADYNAALASVLRTPGEIQTMMAVFGVPAAPPASTPTSAASPRAKPRYKSTEKKATPQGKTKKTAKREGKYSVSGGK